MTDRYLVQRLSEEYSWIKNVYDQTSGYIHLSDKHIYNAFKQPANSAKLSEMVVGVGDNFLGDEPYIEATEAFIEATKILLKHATGWALTKDAKQVANKHIKNKRCPTANSDNQP